MSVISAYGFASGVATMQSRLRQHQCWAAPQPATAVCVLRAVPPERAPARSQRRPRRTQLIRAAAANAPQGTAGSPSSGSSPSSPAQLLLRALGQLALLAVALAGLILLPAWLSGRLVAEPARAGARYILYFLFFGSGTLVRMLQYGQLAPRKQDAQLRSSGSRLAFALFLIAVPAGHYLAWWRGAGLPAALAAVGSGGSSGALALLAQLLEAVGYALMLAGWALNAAAAAALGKAYNRLVTPDALVTTGAYSLVQHPIYTSYMMLFCGHCLSLGSPLAAAFLWAACLVYYSKRTAIEEELLEVKFGDEYDMYRSKVGRFVPRLQGGHVGAH